MRTLSQPVMLLLWVLVWCMPSPAAKNEGGTTPTPTPPRPLHIYRALIPLGSEMFSFSSHQKDERATFYVMASAQNREFEGEQLCMDGEHHVLRNATGTPVQSYPREVHFRISVSQREGYSPLDSPFPVDSRGSTFNEFISKLKFEMRIFHALKARIVKPTTVTHIGIPPDVPANERVYEVTFDLGDVPISDRIVMHVLTGEGERLAKFNFDLY